VCVRVSASPASEVLLSAEDLVSAGKLAFLSGVVITLPRFDERMVGRRTGLTAFSKETLAVSHAIVTRQSDPAGMVMHSRVIIEKADQIESLKKHLWLAYTAEEVTRRYCTIKGEPLTTAHLEKNRALYDVNTQVAKRDLKVLHNELVDELEALVRAAFSVKVVDLREGELSFMMAKFELKGKQ
jgi:hypothetical protein